MKTQKHKPRQVRRKKVDADKNFKEMLEAYTLVPPSPYALKRMRRRKGRKVQSSIIKKQ